MRWLAVLLVALSACGAESRREAMVREQIEERGITNAVVLAAMRKVPREEFVPEGLRALAFRDGPLPIGRGQTISQPYIVALMSELVEVKRGDKVLEVGTGSGYQAAVLAEMGAEVYSVEIVEWLATSAAERLKRLGYGKVKVTCGDGYVGWKEHAPFDAVMVTCAVEPEPPSLIEQLKPGGRLVVPLGEPGETQMLVVLRKDAKGKVTRRDVAPVLFVPLVRKNGSAVK
jgi:protein-L-isoaspartate(D-aspartate) O-methyltransferase